MGPARGARAPHGRRAVTPSARQREAFEQGKPGPRVLFCEHDDGDSSALAAVARAHGGRLGWAAAEEEILCGRVARHAHAASLHVRSLAAARACVDDPAFHAALGRAGSRQVAVLSEQPRALRIASAMMARVLPLWPFDNTLAEGEEPGVGTSTVMPTAETIAGLPSHPDQRSPITMINWLKFKPGGGREAYHRYGKVAMTTTHSIGAKLVFAARYRQILVGNGGDPGLKQWDEFALMQYPGREKFGYMAQLARYRAGLADREAGLAEYGQGLTLSRPRPEFTWRG